METSFTTTLIASGKLTAKHLRDATGLLRDAGVAVDDAHWLDVGEAAILPCVGDKMVARGALSALATDMPTNMDIIVGHSRPARLIIADMDSTMIEVECIDELADFAGLKPQIAAITQSAMRGEIDFAGALQRRVALLSGLDATVIDQCLAERVTIMPGAKCLIATMRARGARAVLVSGGFMSFAGPVAAEIGFEQAIANQLEMADGRLTGRVLGDIVDSDTKLAVLQAEMAKARLSSNEVLAVGDGANDAPMLRAAGLGIAYHAHAVAEAAADAAIRHHDLSAILWAQGHPRAQWVAG